MEEKVDERRQRSSSRKYGGRGRDAMEKEQKGRNMECERRYNGGKKAVKEEK